MSIATTCLKNRDLKQARTALEVADKVGNLKLAFAEMGISDEDIEPYLKVFPNRNSSAPTRSAREPTARRLENILKRMRGGEIFYMGGPSPRISRREIQALENLGFQIQEEHGLHEDHLVWLLDTSGQLSDTQS